MKFKFVGGGPWDGDCQDLDHNREEFYIPIPVTPSLTNTDTPMTSVLCHVYQVCRGNGVHFTRDPHFAYRGEAWVIQESLS